VERDTGGPQQLLDLGRGARAEQRERRHLGRDELQLELDAALDARSASISASSYSGSGQLVPGGTTNATERV